MEMNYQLKLLLHRKAFIVGVSVIGLAYFFLIFLNYYLPLPAKNENFYGTMKLLLDDDHILISVDDHNDVIPVILQKSFDKMEDEYSINEAKGCLERAAEMIVAGKLEKAHKLFQHAIALAPKHPDVLNEYGEFLESFKNELIKADHLYFKALTYCPDHADAFINRERVASVVEELDKVTLRRIDMKRNKLAKIHRTLQEALSRAQHEIYFQHIYHTVGIEGNTMTLSQTRSIVETRMAVGGKSIVEHNEILGLDAALKFINTTLVNRIGPLTIEDILEIHKRVHGFVDPTEAGIFRRTDVFVGNHIPPSPSAIHPRMDEFEKWLNSEETLNLHPIDYAALAHYKLVYIHPFLDGNGRTSRLLMNSILMRAGYPPAIIMKQDRHRYYKMLELANEGDVRPFIRFIAECTENTLDLFLWSTNEYTSERPAISYVQKIDYG